MIGPNGTLLVLPNPLWQAAFRPDQRVMCGCEPQSVQSVLHLSCSARMVSYSDRAGLARAAPDHPPSQRRSVDGGFGSDRGTIPPHHQPEHLAGGCRVEGQRCMSFDERWRRNEFSDRVGTATWRFRFPPSVAGVHTRSCVCRKTQTRRRILRDRNHRAQPCCGDSIEAAKSQRSTTGRAPKPGVRNGHLRHRKDAEK